jgi:acid phosphatase family membrane protein YuiD
MEIIIYNYYFLSFVTSYIIAAILKIGVASYKKRKLNLKSSLENGGMPSMHTSSIISITVAIAIENGLTPLFFLAVVISTIIMSDAVKVRKNLGDQGDALNTLLNKKLKIVHGHTIMQVLVGFIIGVLTPLILGYFYGLL